MTTSKKKKEEDKLNRFLGVHNNHSRESQQQLDGCHCNHVNGPTQEPKHDPYDSQGYILAPTRRVQVKLIETSWLDVSSPKIGANVTPSYSFYAHIATWSRVRARSLSRDERIMTTKKLTMQTPWALWSTAWELEAACGKAKHSTLFFFSFLVCPVGGERSEFCGNGSARESGW